MTTTTPAITSPATTSSLVPLSTPFWFSGSNNFSCPASIIDNSSPSSATYCCNGLLVDITQHILGVNADPHPFYFRNLQCCSGDPDVALGSVTFCSAGTQADLATLTADAGSSSGTSRSAGSMSAGTSVRTTSSAVSTAGGTMQSVAASTTSSKSEEDRIASFSWMGHLCLGLGLFAVLHGF